MAVLFFAVCLSQTGTRVLAESPRELACSTEIKESDTALAEYVRKYVPQGLEPVEGTYRVSDIYCKRNGDTERTDYEFETAIYTFASEKSEEVYTVVSLVYPYEAWKKGTYEHTLYVADSLWPYSPVEGVLYTRNTQEEAWKEERQIIPPRMGLQMISFSGKQLATTKPYARIIFDFPSSNNPDASREKPLYLLQNTINEVLFIPLWLILGIAAVIIIAAVGTVLLNTGRKRHF